LIHKHTGGATASQFAVTSSGGMTMTSFGFTEQPEVLKIGTVADLSLAYTGCRVGDFYLGSILYFGAGTSTPCARMTLSPAPTSPIPGEVAMVDCVNAFLVPATGQAIVNPNGTCQCDVGVNETTWGSIKALYQ
jgi:hypothetical protein